MHFLKHALGRLKLPIRGFIGHKARISKKNREKEAEVTGKGVGVMDKGLIGYTKAREFKA